MMGRAALYEPIDNRRSMRTAAATTRTRWRRPMLLDPNARLSASGYFEA